MLLLVCIVICVLFDIFLRFFFFFFNDTATTEIYTLSLHDALPISMTEHFALEWGPHGIRCNAVAPGFMAKMMSDSRPLDEAAFTRRVGLVPTRRAGRHEDIAQAAIFLASDAASQINGQTVLVDGGLGRALLNLI